MTATVKKYLVINSLVITHAYPYFLIKFCKKNAEILTANVLKDLPTHDMTKYSCLE